MTTWQMFRTRKWVRIEVPFEHSLGLRIYATRINTATAPVWQSETSKPEWRGKLVVFGMMCVRRPSAVLKFISMAE